ncbi:MAG: hypothetical protein ACK4UN_00340, partial [Limisphaerales bacterium]
MSRNRPHLNANLPKFWTICAALFIAALGRAEAEPIFSKAGIPKARVAIVEQADATEMFLPRPEAIPDLFRRGLLHYTRADNEPDAWRSLVSSNDVVGIKVFSSPGPNSGTRPVVVEALVESLLRANIPPGNIILWDKSRDDLRRGGFLAFESKYKIKVAAASEFGWDDTVFYESAIIGTPVWGDSEFGKKGERIGRNSFVSKLLTQRITKLISVSPLLNQNLVGVTGHLYSLSLGSVDNTVRFETRRERLETAVPEIAGMPEIFD